MSGYIKLYRQFLNWEWYGDLNTKCLFLHFLLKANHKATHWQGIKINPGQFVTSYSHLAQETGLSIQKIRTCISRLISTHEVTKQSHALNTVITIKNWALYQDSNTVSNNQITTNNNDKNNSSIVEYILSHVVNTQKKQNDKKERKRSERVLQLPQEDYIILSEYAKRKANKNYWGYLHSLLLEKNETLTKQIISEEKRRRDLKKMQQETQKNLENLANSTTSDFQEQLDALSTKKEAVKFLLTRYKNPVFFAQYPANKASEREI